MRLLLFLALLIFSVKADNTCTLAKSDACDSSVLECCDQNFQTALSLDCNNKPIYKNPDCLTKVMDQIYFGGQAFKLCGAFNTFRSCLGPSARSCTSLQYFLTSGSSVQLSQTDEGLYGQLSFICGAGLDTILRTLSGNPQVFDGKYEIIEKCNFEFTQRIRKKPKEGCTILQQLVSCYQLSFANEVPEMAWYMCEFARSIGSPFAPHCDVTCSSTV